MSVRIVAAALVLFGVGSLGGRETTRQHEPRAETRSVHAPVADDELLRRQVARAIYGSPSFWRLAALPDAPIRITVTDGHVTLAGEVPEAADRALAASLAQKAGALSVTNALVATAPR